jgi:hypothetical protein
MNEAYIASRMTARHPPLFTLESGQSGLGIYTSQRDAALGFAVDVRTFLRDPMAVLSARARQQLPDDPLEVAATSSAELPLRLRRSLLNAEPSRSVLIRIDDDAPAERLEIRWQTALRICAPLLNGRSWRVVSLSPGLEQGARWNHGCSPFGTGVP